MPRIYTRTDHTGIKYNKLLVLKMIKGKPNTIVKAKCLCDCGNTIVTAVSDLKRNYSTQWR